MIDAVLIILLVAMAGYAVHLRDLINRCNQRIDRTVTAIQRESSERGKLNRRIAQTETKVSRLKRIDR